VLGEVWAEQVARGRAHRGHASWPDDERALVIARRRVAQLASDPRLVEALAATCVKGAAGWWERRPARYR
jgi:hypothetical protein